MTRAAALPLLAVVLAADVSHHVDRTALFVVHVAPGGALLTRLVCVDLDRRRVLWSRNTEDTFEVAIHRLGGVILFPRGELGRVEALSAATGRVLWTAEIPPFRSLLPLDDATWLAAGRGTRLACYRRQSWGIEQVWSLDLPREGRMLLPSGGRVVVPTYDEVYCFNPLTGEVLWRHSPENVACFYAAVDRGRVIAWDWWGGRLDVLSVETGALLWNRPTASPWVFEASGGLVLGTEGRSGAAMALSIESGAELWRLPALAPQVELPRTGDLGYSPFVGPAVLGREAWFVSSADERTVLRLEARAGAQQSSRALPEPLVGTAAAPPWICAASASRLHFFQPRSAAEWTLDLEEPILHLRAGPR